MTDEKKREKSHKKVTNNYKIRIGNILVQFNLENLADNGNGYAIPKTHRPFTQRKGLPDTVVHLHQGKIPELDLGEKIFDWGGTLSLYKSDGKFIVPFVSKLFGSRPYKVAIFDKDFNQGDLYLPSVDGELKGNKAISLEYYLNDFDELLALVIINCLGLGRGMLLHACGVIREGKGLIFAGTSGAGKSTMANLWKTRNDVTILGDDRIIVAKEKEDFVVYGTVWQGDAKVRSPESAPADKLYFIKHSRKNYIRAVKGADAATWLLVRSFPPLFNPEGMEYTLSFCTELVENIPAYEMGFSPDESIVSFVERHL